MKYHCNICNYSTDYASNWCRHNKSKSHLNKSNEHATNSLKSPNFPLESPKIPPKNKNLLIQKKEHMCEYCNLIISRSDHLLRHYKTCKEKTSQEKKEKLRLREEKNKIRVELKIKMLEEKINFLKTHNDMLEKENEEKIKLLKEQNNILQEENKYHKQLIISAGNMIQSSMSTLNHLLLNYNNAPPLEPLKDYSVLEDKNKFIDNLTYYHSKNKLDEYLGDFLVKHYKTEDPKERSNWNSDTSRLTYINRELVNNKPNWVIDKNGVKMTELIIDPYMQYIKKIAIEKIAEMKDICDDDDDYDNKKCIFNKMTSLNEIIQNINNKILSKEINKYLAPHFYFDKNNLLMVREN